MSVSLLEHLVNEKLLTPEQAEQVAGEQRMTKQSIPTLLRRLGLLGEDELLGFLSRKYRVPVVDCRGLTPSGDLVKLVSAQLVRRYRVLPIRRTGNTVTLALSDPTLIPAIDDVQFATGLRVIPVLASEAAIEMAICKYHREPITTSTDWQPRLVAVVHMLVGLFLLFLLFPGPGVVLVSVLACAILALMGLLPIGLLFLLPLTVAFWPILTGRLPHLLVERLQVLAPLAPGVAPATFVLALTLALTAASVVGGVSLLRRARRARGFVLGLGVVHIVNYPLFPVSTALGAYTIWGLTRKARPSNLFTERAQNRRASWVITAIFTVVVALVAAGAADYGFIVGGFILSLFGVSVPRPSPLIAAGIGTLVGACLAGLAHRYGDRAILASSFARPIAPGDPNAQMLVNVVEEMAIAAGLPPPRVCVVDDPDPNAFALGRDPAHAVIVVTRGLLTTMARDELQAIVAHEMAHIRTYDTRKMTLITALLGAILLLIDRAGHDRPEKGEEGVRGLGRLAGLAEAFVVAMVGQALAMAVSRRREYLADATAAELTRNPATLAQALLKLAGAPGPTRRIPRGTAHLCIVDPLGHEVNDREDPVADLLASHPPLSERVARLEAMAYQT